MGPCVTRSQGDDGGVCCVLKGVLGVGLWKCFQHGRGGDTVAEVLRVGQLLDTAEKCSYGQGCMCKVGFPHALEHGRIIAGVNGLVLDGTEGGGSVLTAPCGLFSFPPAHRSIASTLLRHSL